MNSSTQEISDVLHLSQTENIGYIFHARNFRDRIHRELRYAEEFDIDISQSRTLTLEGFCQQQGINIKSLGNMSPADYPNLYRKLLDIQIKLERMTGRNESFAELQYLSKELHLRLSRADESSRRYLKQLDQKTGELEYKLEDGLQRQLATPINQEEPLEGVSEIASPISTRPIPSAQQHLSSAQSALHSAHYSPPPAEVRRNLQFVAHQLRRIAEAERDHNGAIPISHNRS